jgi:hypothetical protein
VQFLMPGAILPAVWLKPKRDGNENRSGGTQRSQYRS